MMRWVVRLGSPCQHYAAIRKLPQWAIENDVSEIGLVDADGLEEGLMVERLGAWLYPDELPGAMLKGLFRHRAISLILDSMRVAVRR